MASYRPGERVEHSGIYRIERGCPACPAEVALLENDRFPACSGCSERRYRLHLAAPAIEDDPDFR